MNKKSLPRTVAAARFDYEFTAPGRNDGVKCKAASQCACPVVVAKTDVRSNLTKTRRENVVSHAGTDFSNFIAGDREAPAGDFEMTSFFGPNQRAIEPEFNAWVGARIWDKVFGINRRY